MTIDEFIRDIAPKMRLQDISEELEKLADDEQEKFDSNLLSRVRNYSLVPSQDNALLPLFEAITNSIHAVQDKFESDWKTKGNIEVFILSNKDGKVQDITIEDNGIGLNYDNFKSFKTTDSPYKIKKGGKGIGRLSWLKAFEKVHISSIFEYDCKKYKREFDFRLDEDEPISSHIVSEVDYKEKTGTNIILKNMKDSYVNKFPEKINIVVQKALFHFLPMLIAGAPSIHFINDSDDSDIKEIFQEHKYNEQTFTIKMDDEDTTEFTLQNIMIDKKIISEKSHMIYFAANERIVGSHNISNQIGLSKHFAYKDHDVYYVGIISGEYMNGAVVDARNGFYMDEKFRQALIKKVLSNIESDYLKDQIDYLLEVKTKRLEGVLTEYPRYSYMITDKKTWAKSYLPANALNEEDIFKQLSIYDYRANKDIKKEIKDVLNKSVKPEEVDEKIAEIVTKIGDQNKSSLAEYVAKRKGILDLLESKLGYEDVENQKRYAEEAVHKIICPMIVDSNDITIDNHNLWILDDRLAYYQYFASDKQIKQFVSSSESKKEPDIILFNGCTLFERKNQNQPVVIVEFKRPARKDYSAKENPITQIYDYIDDLKNKKVVTPQGKLITEIDDKTPFYCYIVCDITPSLRNILKRDKMDRELPGGRGLYGENPSYNAYFEILEYETILKDARLRNEAFFKECLK